MGRLRLHEREAVRALWRGHFEALAAERTEAARILRASWRIAEEIRNWRGQLRREDVAGGDGRWGRHPQL